MQRKLEVQKEARAKTWDPLGSEKNPKDREKYKKKNKAIS